MARNKKGQFLKGDHWREKKPYWDKNWLYNEYITNKKSSVQIAKEQNCQGSNIRYFLDKHKIPTRSIAETRELLPLRGGLFGSANGMYGRTGDKSSGWKGGITPERQCLYSSSLWAEIIVAVHKRDKSECQRCGHKNDNRRFLHIHHISPFENKNLRTDLDNLVLLCAKCHSWVHSKKNVENIYIDDKNYENQGEFDL